MKINLYQRQHPLNLTHGARPTTGHNNPYSMTSSNSSVDFTYQSNSMYQIAICEEPLYIIKSSSTNALNEKPIKIRLRLDKGVLQYTEYDDDTRLVALYDLSYENPYILKSLDSKTGTSQIQLSSAESSWILCSQDSHLIEELYNFLKFYAIMPNFSENYSIEESLYEAPQFTIKRKSDNTNLIAKSYLIETEADCNRNLSMLLKDIRTNRQIDHAKFSKLREIYETQSYAFLVYDCELTTTLENHVAINGPLSESDAKSIMRRLIKSLSYLHKKLNTSYRNLRPPVIMLNALTFDIQLIDLAYTLDHSRSNTEVKKTPPPGYLAPEILKCKKEAVGVDVFSLGAVMFFCLTGSPPFPGEDLIEINTNNKKCDITYPEIWPELSKEAQELIKKMLHPHSAFRPDFDEIETHNWLFDISQVTGTQILKETKKEQLNYLQIFKNRKAFKRAQQDEEDCNGEAVHSLPVLIKHTSNQGIFNNPFKSVSLERTSEAVRSLQFDVSELSKKNVLNSDRKTMGITLNSQPNNSNNEEVPEEEEGSLLNKMSRLSLLSNKFEKSPFFINSRPSAATDTHDSKKRRGRSKFSGTKTIEDVESTEKRRAKPKMQTSLKSERTSTRKAKRQKSADPTKKPKNLAQKLLQIQETEEPFTPTFVIPQ